MDFGNGASLHATCQEAAPSISALQLVDEGGDIKKAATFSAFGSLSAKAHLLNVPATCATSSITKPCAPNGAEYRPPLFHCVWSSPPQGGTYRGEPVLAQTAELVASDGKTLIGLSVFLMCALPPLDNFIAMSAFSDAWPDGDAIKLKLEVRHFAPMSAADDFATAATNVSYRGIFGGDTFSVYASSPPLVPPPFAPPPPSPPSFSAFGGVFPVSSCMTFNNEVANGQLRAKNTNWNYCTSGDNKPSLYDGDTSTEVSTGKHSAHSPMHDDTVAYDFGKVISFRYVSVWGSGCTHNTWGVSTDGVEWKGGQLWDRVSWSCANPGSRSALWVDIGEQTARYFAMSMGSGSAKIYEMQVLSPDAPVAVTSLGGKLPVSSCMTFNNEVANGQLKSKNTNWNYCTAGDNMPSLYDGDTSTEVSTGKHSAHSPMHDDTVAYDFGKVISFRYVSVWGSGCTHNTWGVSTDGVEWKGGQLWDRVSWSCANPGSRSALWVDIGEQTARYFAMSMGSGSAKIYEMQVK